MHRTVRELFVSVQGKAVAAGVAIGVAAATGIAVATGLPPETLPLFASALTGALSGLFAVRFAANRADRLLRKPLTTVSANLKRLAENNFTLERAEARLCEIDELMNRQIALVASLKDRERAFERERNALKRISLEDGLTGLPNRLALREKREQMHKEHWLVLVHLLHLDRIREFYGEPHADALLLTAADRLRGQLHRRVFRFDENSFALLLEKGTTPVRSEIRTLVAKLGRLETETDGVRHRVASCAGIVAGEEENAEDKGLMALQEALVEGEEAVVLFDRSNPHLVTHEQNILWSKKLKEGFEHDRVVPFFQAIYHNGRRQIEHFEALARFIDGDGKVIAPRFFLRVAQNTGLYPKVTETVLRKSFEHFAPEPHRFSLNVTIPDIANLDLPGMVRRLGDTHGISPERVVFELNQEPGMEHNPHIRTFLEEARSMGCGLVLDGFGGGCDNMLAATRLGLEGVKICGDLIKEIAKPGPRSIVEAIVHFARENRLYTVAQFVHSKAVFEAVRELGVDYSQGSFIADPAPEL